MGIESETETEEKDNKKSSGKGEKRKKSKSPDDKLLNGHEEINPLLNHEERHVHHKVQFAKSVSADNCDYDALGSSDEIVSSPSKSRQVVTYLFDNYIYVMIFHL